MDAITEIIINGEEVKLPTRMAVCPRCNGRGKHDAWEGGMTREEMFEQGDEFIEDYIAGVYNVTCTVCRGRNVVEEVDEGMLTPEQRIVWEETCQEVWESYAIQAAEMRAGA